mmetsp:Transcript_23168/g.54220  ORF Transcript_23168/g.54220 Transcript_23168/m.54220 type:complete len:196 (+) Transcript_23168:49-636(+)|eukprot:CAMPEP_0171090518 /NCGR_PEP_ID=MMETSP0766_2-20121228/31658_1 /TAXON_ID=439317 /ORGANISM="Gambierdiscus australes, Strain CAWD 149" /LENGTH=195 /DNA_ID=CAMNT_0011548515 /DNA_START=49 /DNA_END=636 /DNA_ORIENTATION=-
MVRSRGNHPLALVLMAAAALAVRALMQNFVVGLTPQLPQAQITQPQAATALRAKLSAKEKQRARSKAKQGAEVVKAKSKNEPWPVEIPDGITVLHVEYGQEAGEFPKPGNREVLDFYSLLQTRFGHKVRILHNYPKALKELSPTGGWRKGSFEVVDLGGKRVLYSKLNTGLSLVHGDEGYLESWLSKFAELCNIQ